jgi:hypothetical protein
MYKSLFHTSWCFSYQRNDLLSVADLEIFGGLMLFSYAVGQFDDFFAFTQQVMHHVCAPEQLSLPANIRCGILPGIPGSASVGHWHFESVRVFNQNAISMMKIG